MQLWPHAGALPLHESYVSVSRGLFCSEWVSVVCESELECVGPYKAHKHLALYVCQTQPCLPAVPLCTSPAY